MRKLNKQIIVLVLLLPMLVMLVHDIIPHHHHKTPTTTNYVKMNHTHLGAEHSHCGAHQQTQHLGHSHEKHETKCCSFGNLRFFKSFKFQVFITHVILDMLVPKDFTPKKYYVSDFILIPEPKREAYNLRGPPLV